MQAFPRFGLSVHLLLGILLMTLLTGCREKLPYSVAGVALPDLADQPAQVAPPEERGGGIAESITFQTATPGLYEGYIDWLTRKGWTRRSETQEVTLIRSIMVKDGTQLTLIFTPRQGLNISGVRPAGSPSEENAPAGDSK